MKFAWLVDKSDEWQGPGTEAWAQRSVLKWTLESQVAVTAVFL